jgi:hypothetical protein
MTKRSGFAASSLSASRKEIEREELRIRADSADETDTNPEAFAVRRPGRRGLFFVSVVSAASGVSAVSSARIRIDLIRRVPEVVHESDVPVDLEFTRENGRRSSKPVTSERCIISNTNRDRLQA